MNDSEPLIEQKRQQLAACLDTLQIKYQSYCHPPLMTCQEADRIGLIRSGSRIKNLFLQDNVGKRHFLLITYSETPIDLKMLAKEQQTKRLGFASERRLAHYLNATRGCVSILGLFYDQEQQVELWIDRQLWHETNGLQCHPLDNRQTWVISKPDLTRFIEYTRHSIQLVDL
ncbi:YbaK/EbsC family protein [Celerinatantimonas sp. YJH-8]|uniref:YbaK/EbsC family protein n=1 Tax=Celerinatantimonas sp. YJH-8 TaxID=3228714 RepID=UPI0038C11344